MRIVTPSVVGSCSNTIRFHGTKTLHQSRFYRPQTKLREGNVSMGLCLFMGAAFGYSPSQGWVLPAIRYMGYYKIQLTNRRNSCLIGGIQKNYFLKKNQRLDQGLNPDRLLKSHSNHHTRKLSMLESGCN